MLFFNLKRSQISYVSILLITLIVISSSIFIYWWGRPYMEKVKANKEIEYLEKKFADIENAFNKVIKLGSYCISLETDADIRISKKGIIARYISPIKIYNPAIEIPITIDLFKSKKEFILTRVGESKTDVASAVIFLHNDTTLHVKDEISGKTKYVREGIIITSNALYIVYPENGKFRVIREYFLSKGKSCISTITSVPAGRQQIIDFKLGCYYGKTEDNNLFKIEIIPAPNKDLIYSKGKNLCFELKDIKKEPIESTVSDYVTVYNVYVYFE